ncbi:hypothetical protein C2S51_021607 [Perilla frutescens var. frutescens]|nr:hypothetical protein C2S51_021607 [Perilla frutescens var. frutescens]
MGSPVKESAEIVSNRHDPDLKTGDGDEIVTQRLLLKRFHDSPVDGVQYFFALSPENFSATKKIYFPLFDEFKFVAGSCNGLVCLDDAMNKSMLWNPSTQEVSIIPYHHRRGYRFTDKLHSFSCGFGYDNLSHDFKLIRFVNGYCEVEDKKYDGYEYIVELYSLKSNSWKYIEPPLYVVLRNPSVYINGCYYWLAYGASLPFIMSFNFSTEEFSYHGMPDVGRVLGGFSWRHGVIVFPKLGTGKTFELWLRINGKGWSKEHDIRVPGAERPLGFWKDYRYLFFEGINRQLMVYDMMTGEVTGLDIFDDLEKFQLVPYVESTVSIKGLMGSCDAASTKMEEN